MGLFSWFKKKETALLPDIQRIQTPAEFAPILEEYSTRMALEKVGLVLGGGGSKGRWQAGVLAYMAQVGLLKYINVVSGTSVGGLIGGIAVRYLDESSNLQTLVDIWRGIVKNSDVFLGEMPSNFFNGIRALFSINGPSFVDPTPLYNLAKKHFAGITQFRIPFYVVATAYETRKPVILGPGTPAVDQVLATSAVPVGFPAYRASDGIQYMDGGCVMNVSYPYLLEIGCTKIVVLYCDPDASKQVTTSPKATALTTGTAAIDALYQVQEESAYNDLEKTLRLRKAENQSPIEIAHFYPSVPTGSLLDFESNHDLLQAGYSDAVKYLTPDKVKEFLKS